MYLTSEIDTEIGQISPKFPRNPQSDFTICLPTLGRHPTFRTLPRIYLSLMRDRAILGARAKAGNFPILWPIGVRFSWECNLTGSGLDP